MPNKEKESNYKKIDHPIPPLYDKESRILILGSFPSVKSREAAFFYGHKQNRFWKVTAGVLSQAVPQTVEEKKAFLHENHIAVWDVIKSCEIIGSSDSSIKNVVPNDISKILDESRVSKIYCNGAKSYEYYVRFLEEIAGRKAEKLPSTSPANAAFSVDKLKDNWKKICVPLKAAPENIGQVLLSWYDYNGRILPWRSDPTPYHVWISEIMLQQTRVEAVKRYYERWMEELPTVKELAEVPDEKLMKLWEGLGYYNRVRNLKAAANTVMEEYAGALPSEYEELLSLKGIGEYTAGAISSIAFGKAVTAVDGNVLRVFSRILAKEGEVDKTAVKKAITKEVKRVLPHERPGDFNQALMDLGSMVCLPGGAPICDECPWEAVCQAHKEGRETEYPVKTKKKKRKIQEKGVFLIEVGDQIYLHKRASKGLLPDLWEFPNVDGAFTLEKARQEIEAWNIKDYEIESIGEGKHIFSHVEWHMKGYRVHLGEYAYRIAEEKAWVAASKEEVEKIYAIPSAFSCYKDKL